MISAAVVARLSAPVAAEALGPVALDGQPEPIELYALHPRGAT
jgi:class 3 adenylate cyclase